MGFWINDLKDDTKDLKVNAWNWRPTLELLEQFQVLDAEELERMSFTGGGGQATPEQARIIADRLEAVLERLKSKDRILYDLTVTNDPDTFELHREQPEKNYSATYEWLAEFAAFCRTCDGFTVI
jgi:hypothetical protein